MNQVHFKDLGVKNYKETWDYQNELFQKIIAIKVDNREKGTNNPTSNYLLFTEHPHVYTLGKSGDFNNLLLNEKQLIEKGAEIYEVKILDGLEEWFIQMTKNN